MLIAFYLSIIVNKNVFIQQINEEIQVKVVWSRGKGQLESKVGLINPKTHEAKIDDIFKMNTSLDFDEVEYKFMPKNSVISIIFA